MENHFRKKRGDGNFIVPRMPSGEPVTVENRIGTDYFFNQPFFMSLVEAVDGRMIEKGEAAGRKYFFCSFFFQKPGLFQPIVVLSSILKESGWAAIIYLAAMSTINPELYEAARVDGANVWQVVSRITVPLLYPTLFFIATMSVIGSLNLFAEPYVLTNNTGPLNSTLTMVGYLFLEGFYYFKLGFASAVGWAIAFITAVISWFFMRFLSARAGFT